MINDGADSTVSAIEENDRPQKIGALCRSLDRWGRLKKKWADWMKSGYYTLLIEDSGGHGSSGRDLFRQDVHSGTSQPTGQSDIESEAGLFYGKIRKRTIAPPLLPYNFTAHHVNIVRNKA